MLNTVDEHKILEHLRNDGKTELMPHDLNEILTEELSKPEKEVDSQLIREILELLEAEEPSSKEKAECWKAVQCGMKKHTVRHQTLLRGTCAAAVVLVVAFFVSFGTARAFNWTFLLKFLSPVAETFGLYSTSIPDQDGAQDNGGYMDAFSEYEQLNYDSLEAMPAQLKGYTIIPGWIPDRFKFVNGAIYEDENMASASLFLCSTENAYLTFDLSVYENDEDVTSYVYEVSTANQSNMEYADHTLTYYHNDDGEIQAVSKIEKNAHFYIGGSISEEELMQIVTSMND